MSRWRGWRRCRDGERSNDTLTFESETNESIMIKLFICLFTMGMERFEGNEMECYKDTVKETKKDKVES